MKAEIKNLFLFIIFFLSVTAYSLAACNCSGNVIGSNQSSTANASSYGTSLSGQWCLHGTLYIDVNYLFTGLELQMGENARIIINNGMQLNIVNNSKLLSCDQQNMWERISVGTNAKIFVHQSSISDAKYAITNDNNSNPTIQISSTIFNKNLNSITINNSLNSSSYFLNCDIRCETDINSGAPGLLVGPTPYNTQRSQTGVTINSLDYFDFTPTINS